MATRDESHMFSLAALTERSPSPVPAPKRISPDPDNIDLGELARAPTFAADFGPPVYPLVGSVADGERIDPIQTRRTAPVVQLALVLGALLLALGIIATAIWSVKAEEAVQALETPAPSSPLTATGAVPPRLETLPKPDANAVAAAPASPEGVALAEATPSSARPSTGESASHAPRPSRRPRPSASPKPPAHAPRPAGACAHCPPQDLACNIKCRAT
jgi:hypothetical protein